MHSRYNLPSSLGRQKKISKRAKKGEVLKAVPVFLGLDGHLEGLEAFELS